MKNDNENSDFKNLPACAAEYISLVIKKMKYKKSVRQDVQNELTAHFADALAACRDDGEKEKTAQKIIADFGDAQLLAVLARRAKKRCRPIWLKALIKTAQTAAAVIILFAIYSLWFFTGKPNITVNYIDIANQLVKPDGAEETQNAAPFYQKAAEVIEQQREIKKIDLGKVFAEANEADIANIKIWLADNKQPFDLIEQGTEKPYYWRTVQTQNPDTTEMLTILMPHLSQYRKMAYGLRWRGYLAASDGKYKEAFDNLITAYKFGKHQKGKKNTH